MKKFIITSISILFPAILFADVPQKINFQGRFSTTSITVDFSITDDNDGSENTLWSETGFSTTTIDGVVNYELGTGGNEISTTVFSSTETRYLKVDLTSPDEPAQYIELLSVPYAYHAYYSDELAGGTTIQGSLNVDGRIKDETGFVMPVGTIVPFAGSSTTVPAGWLLCDGSSYNGSSGQDYEDLWNVIGNTYGGASQSDFDVPDLRGVFPKGAGIQQISGISYSGTYGTTNQDKFQGHYHDVAYRAPGSDSGYANRMILGTNDFAYSQGSDINIGAPKTDGSNGTPRTGTVTEPANVVVNFIIKY